MPLYEYQCDSCAHRFETIQKFSDAPIERCPKCGGPVRKLQSAPAFQFKGTGWYVTDYAKTAKESPGDKKAESTEGKSSDAKDSKETKDSAKPAAKTKTDSGSSSPPAGSAPPSAGD
jgi:putative FmdB family regulatory protein